MLISEFVQPPFRRNLISLSLLLLAGVLSACDGDGVVGPGDEELALQLVAAGLTAPISLAEPPDGTRRLFVVDQAGEIRIVTADGDLLDEPFLDVTDRMVQLRQSFDERGLLGLAFHPDYQTNGRFFIYYSAPLRAGAPNNFNHTGHISEFRVMPGNPNRADPASERILLRVDEPQFNHNGGTLAFGPADGYLYISLGDGGAANDVGVGHVEDWYDANAGGNGQDITQNLLGSILRIDVNAGNPYAIPPDSPFVGSEGLDEIWAYGFRNPYRFSFDMGGNNDLLVGDAGQNLWEEVSLVTRGGNYGWNVKEATHCFDASSPENPPASCPSTAPGGVPLVDPIIEFRNSSAPDGGLSLAVVAGHIYRGTALPGRMRGQYFFGGWSSSFGVPDGVVLVAQPRTGPGLWDFREIRFTNTPTGELGHYLLGFRQDLQGEVYLLTQDNAGPVGNSGRVYRLVSPR